MRKRLPSLNDADVDEPLINLTPLIDVVFVVLITFMLIAPILNVDNVDLAQGGRPQKGAAQSSPVAISVHADNSIWLGGQKMTLAQLEQKLKEEKKLHPGTVPQLIQDSRAQFGVYQSVKNILESVGFEQMDIVLKPNA